MNGSLGTIGMAVYPVLDLQMVRVDGYFYDMDQGLHSGRIPASFLHGFLKPVEVVFDLFPIPAVRFPCCQGVKISPGGRELFAPGDRSDFGKDRPFGGGFSCFVG